MQRWTGLLNTFLISYNSNFIYCLFLMLKNSSHNFYHYFFIQVLHDRVQNRRKSAFLTIERAKSKSCLILFFRSQILSRSLVTIMSQIRSLFFCHFFSKNGPQSDPDLDQIISRTYFWYCRLFYIPKSATKFSKQMFCHIKQGRGRGISGNFHPILYYKLSGRA